MTSRFSLVLFVMVAATTGCDSDDADGSSGCRCGQSGGVCAEGVFDAPDDHLHDSNVAYEYGPEEVRARATGTWSGAFKGNETAEPFSFTLTIGTHEGGEDRFGVYNAGAPDASLVEPAECAFVRLMSLQAALDASVDHYDGEQAAVYGGGATLSSSFDPEDVSRVDGLSKVAGQVGVYFTNGPPGAPTTRTLAFILGADGRLWLSVTLGNEPFDFIEAGDRT